MRSLKHTTLIATVSLIAAAANAAGSDDSFTLPFASAKQATSKMNQLREAFAAIQADAKASRVLKNESIQLGFDQVVASDEVSTTKFQSYYKGIPVIGDQIAHHSTSRGSEITNDITEFDLNVTPALSAEEAMAMAKVRVGDRQLIKAPELKIFPNKRGNSAQLIYWVTLDATASEPGHDVLVDANTGQMIADISHEMNIAPVDVYSATSACQDVDSSGRPTSLNPTACAKQIYGSVPVGGNPDSGSTTPDASAQRAFENSQATLKFYMDNFKRNSYDNKGSRLVSVVHVGKAFNNAFWNSQLGAMGYGDGDGKTFGDFTKGLDVAGHELTHGVTSQTAALIYADESGALNEAFSDFFGVMISGQSDWGIGKQLWIDPAATNGIRDLETPGKLMAKYRDSNGEIVKKPYPAHIKDRFPSSSFCNGTNDNCWVHVNSTIPGHASYLVANVLGRAKAQKLYYTALTQYLSARDDFKSARDKIVKACGALFDSSTCASVETAYAEVGL